MAEMQLDAVRADLGRIQRLRDLYLQESNFQVRYNACHERGWTDSYLLLAGGLEVGYGSIKGEAPSERDTVFEFHVVPPWRTHASRLFAALLAASRVRRIECQSNDRLLSPMLFEFAAGISAQAILFEPHATTSQALPGAVFRRRQDGDRIFRHESEPVGDFVVERTGIVVATGGFLLHYNRPFADLFMEVEESQRRMGVGSLLVQELIRQCYLAGRVPAARCGLQNHASRATLVRAGMRVCGFMLTGEIRTA
jgi:GNAT superfamily N-acetyltransferase